MSMFKKEKQNVSLYKMELFEEWGDYPHQGWFVLRTPGGWIFCSLNGHVFVPYNEEYKDFLELQDAEINETK